MLFILTIINDGRIYKIYISTNTGSDGSDIPSCLVDLFHSADRYTTTPLTHSSEIVINPVTNLRRSETVSPIFSQIISEGSGALDA